MDAAALSSNSRVIVECTDPFNLLDQFKPVLQRHLPLHNLHWRSPNRPLRSIHTLHVEVTAAVEGDGDSKQNSRRHQIPGLRQTPYVKLFLLRCDDNETYKEICRKEIRQWIKNNAQTADRKAKRTDQEFHDAFEWLIVHVVLPNTPAASQPRFTKQPVLGTTDSTDSVASKSKWPGKSSGPLYEKLRADFSGYSKFGVERVAQIRLDAQYPRSSSVVAPNPSSEVDQWDDLVDKLKTAILASFHTRVAQYEEDIRERDAQRHLPGWNFCTFFVLKEGLAQGFENVGLLDDASAVYDELSAGLDDVVQEQSTGDESNQDGSLLPFSKDLKSKIRAALEQLQLGSQTLPEDLMDKPNMMNIMHIADDEMPFNTRLRNYRELILANQVSALDLRIYVFTRQLELSHAKAKSNSHRTELNRNQSTNQQEMDDLPTLSRICRQGTEFISLACRCMRHDLYQAWGGQEGLSQHELQVQNTVINNIVSNWGWNASMQLLSETATSALLIPDEISMKPHFSNSLASDARGRLRLDTRGLEAANHGFTNHAEVENEEGSEDLDSHHSREASVNGAQPAIHLTLYSKAYEFALWKAEVFLCARRILESICHDHNAILTPGLPKPVASHRLKPTGQPDVELKTPDGHLHQDHGDKQTASDDLAGLVNTALRRCAASAETFSALYQTLTSLACRHFLAARKLGSAKRTMGELARVRHRQGDFAGAAAYLDQLIDDSRVNLWANLAGPLLTLYSDCLKQLGRIEEHVSCLMNILSLSSDRVQGTGQDSNGAHVQEVIKDLQTASQKLEREVKINFSRLFNLFDYSGKIKHPNTTGGFSLTFALCSKVDAMMTLEGPFLLFLKAMDGAYPAEIVMRGTGTVRLGTTAVELRFQSNALSHGWYLLERLEAHTGHICFVQDFAEPAALRPPGSARSLARVREPIMVYPCSGAPRVRASPATVTDLTRSRQVRVEILAGLQGLDGGSIALKPATAGLRLQLHEIVLADELDTAAIEFDVKTGLRFDRRPPGSVLALNVPYTIEDVGTREVEVKADLRYVSVGREYTYHACIKVSSMLPISVNVHDIFKDNALYSRFTVSPTTLVPVRLRCCSIKGSQYEICGGRDDVKGVDIFPKQPLSWVCRFRAQSGDHESNSSESPVLLVEFECIDEVILFALETQLAGDISGTECSQLVTLLSSHMCETYRSKWTERDLEVACLRGEIDLWPFEEVGWATLLKEVHEPLRTQATRWLYGWHATRSMVPLASEGPSARCIRIPVEVPKPKLVISVTLDLNDRRTSRTPSIGQPIRAELQIVLDRIWGMRSDASTGKDVRVSYEIKAPPESWLIGGSRRGDIMASDLPVRIPVLLIAQRAGHLMLPSVEIMGFSRTASRSSGTSSTEERQTRCEVDYASHGRSVLVMPNLQRTTIALQAVDGASEYRNLLVGSESRIMDHSA